MRYTEKYKQWLLPVLKEGRLHSLQTSACHIMGAKQRLAVSNIYMVNYLLSQRPLRGVRCCYREGIMKEVAFELAIRTGSVFEK